ncbi:MAG: hypothetical protein LBV46_03610 [Bacteroidales bacterium]|jgi:hypothetical protein|nr:hypothetical protein [Bacteroidales bacterium]
MNPTVLHLYGKPQILDSLLIERLLNYPEVRGYFLTNLVDTIYILDDSLTHNLSNYKLSNIAGKHIVLITENKFPLIDRKNHRIVLQFYRMEWKNRKLIIWFGLERNRLDKIVFLSLKKKKKDYLIASFGCS